MRGAIFFLVYLMLTASIANADTLKSDPIFLQDNDAPNPDVKISTTVGPRPANENNSNSINKSQILRPCTGNSCKLIFTTPDQPNNPYYQTDEVIQPLYNDNRVKAGSLDVYSDCFLDQEKVLETYEFIKKNGLEGTFEGIVNQGDMAMLQKDFVTAEGIYNKALKLNRGSEDVKIKLATCYRKQKRYKEAIELYCKVFESNPNSLDVKINLAFLEMDRKKYKNAIDIFQNILTENKDYKIAKMGLVYSYIADRQNLKALDLLKGMPEDEEVKITKANIYYSLGMYSDAKDAIKGSVSENIIELDNQIRKARAFTMTPSYTFLNQELTEVYDLDIRKVGLNLSQYGANNIKGFLEYGMYVYISGPYFDDHFTDLTNELRGGVEGRPTEKFAFRSDIGVKIFQSGGALLNTDSWAKYFAKDTLTYKIGFQRNNAEQSYLSAVGFPINGVFTGRVAVNKAYAEVDGQLPNQFYYNVKAGGGAYTAQNLPTNAFVESYITLGKTLFNNPNKKWIQKAAAEVMSYNTSFQMNMINIPGATGPRKTFGGYFSPSFYTANTIAIKLEGEKKQWRIKYGIKGFIGGQNEYTPDFVSVVYGVFPYLSYNLNDHICLNLSYSYSNYASILRHLAIISIEIKGYNKNKLSKDKTHINSPIKNGKIFKPFFTWPFQRIIGFVNYPNFQQGC